MVTTLILFLLINGYFIISLAFFVWVWIAVRGRRRNLAQGAGSAKTATDYTFKLYISPTANVTMYNFNISKCLRDLTCWSRVTLDQNFGIRGDMTKCHVIGKNSRMFLNFTYMQMTNQVNAKKSYKQRKNKN